MASFKKDYEEDSRSLADLSQKYLMSWETLKRIAEENGFKKRNNNTINKHIKSDYFSVLDSKEKAYWLGFLFTDGSVDKGNKSGRIRFQLQEEDLEILEKYKECLGLDSKIIYDVRPNSTCCSVEFVDNQIFNDLANYGIVPRKTYVTEHIPFEKIPEPYLKSFILGLLDGDGGITFSKDFHDITLGFTSYHQSCAEEIQQEIDKLIEKEEHNKVFFTSAWHVQWRGRLQVLKILDILYEDCPIHLERKYKKYLQLKESLK